MNTQTVCDFGCSVEGAKVLTSKKELWEYSHYQFLIWASRKTRPK